MDLHNLDNDDEDLPPTLTELDPSPVDETPSYFASSTSTSKTPQATNSEGYFPSTPSHRTSTTLGLSHTSIPVYLRLTQKYSSITFSAFAALHITNTAILPLMTRNVQDASKYLLLTRPYYQSFPLEPLLVVLPLALHVSSGVALRLWHRRVLVRKAGAETADHKRQVAWPKLSGTSIVGYAAVPLVLGHSALTRMLPLWIEGGSSSVGLDYVGHGVALAPVAGFLGFSALVGVVGTHVVWGGGKWAGVTPDLVGRGVGEGEKRVVRRRRRWVVNAVVGLVVGIWAAGGIGIVARGGKVGGWVGRVYDGLYNAVPVLGGYV